MATGHIELPSRSSDAGPDEPRKYNDAFLEHHDEAETWLSEMFSDRLNGNREKFAMHLRWLRGELDAMERGW